MLVMLISFGWGWASLPRIEVHVGPVPASITMAVALCGSTFWGIASIYAIDLLASHRNRNSHFLKVFYRQFHKDLLIAALTATILFLIGRTAGLTFDPQSISIGSAGISLLVPAAWTLLKAKDKQGILQFNFRMKIALVGVQVAQLALACWALSRVIAGTFTASASLWVQATIVAAGVASYVCSQQVSYFLAHRRVAFSPTIQRILKGLRGNTRGIYDVAVEASEQFNREVRVATSKRAAIRRANMRRRKAGK